MLELSCQGREYKADYSASILIGNGKQVMEHIYQILLDIEIFMDKFLKSHKIPSKL